MKKNKKNHKPSTDSIEGVQFPSSWKVGLHHYEVVKDPLADGLWGACCPDDHKIVLGPRALKSLSERTPGVWSTLVHELCHAAMHEHGVSKSAEFDEAVTRIVESVICRVIVDNPSQMIQLVLGISESNHE